MILHATLTAMHIWGQKKKINATQTEAIYRLFLKKEKITQKLAIQQWKAWKTEIKAKLN